MLHFIRVYTVCKGEKDPQTKEKKLLPDTLQKVQWTIRSLLYQTSRKNPFAYKGLRYALRMASYRAWAYMNRIKIKANQHSPYLFSYWL